MSVCVYGRRELSARAREMFAGDVVTCGLTRLEGGSGVEANMAGDGAVDLAVVVAWHPESAAVAHSARASVRSFNCVIPSIPIGGAWNVRGRAGVRRYVQSLILPLVVMRCKRRVMERERCYACGTPKFRICAAGRVRYVGVATGTNRLGLS